MDFRSDLNSINNKSWKIAHAQALLFNNLVREEKIKFIALAIIFILTTYYNCIIYYIRY